MSSSFARDGVPLRHGRLAQRRRTAALPTWRRFGRASHSPDAAMPDVATRTRPLSCAATRAAKRSMPTLETDAFIHPQAATLPLDESGANK